MSTTRIAGGLAVMTILAAGGFVVDNHQHRVAASPATSTQVATATVTRASLTATQLVDATLGYAPTQPVIVRRRGTYTSLPPEGTIVQPGQPVAHIDARPVILLMGTVSAWRPLAVGVTDGPDVLELKRGLALLGFGSGGRVDQHFTTATDRAVRRWQTALGEPATGVIDDGDIVFLPSPVRVGHLGVAIGGPAEPGQAPYAATSTTRVVHAQLDASRQQGIAVGSAVTVDLPGGPRVPGKVSALGRVASTPPDTSNGGGSTRPTVSLDVALDNADAAGDLDQQPVQIEMVTASAANVLAVPVTALLALSEGGYGVEVVPATGPHRIVAVTPGLFASGLVELTGSGVSAGTVVVVAK